MTNTITVDLDVLRNLLASTYPFAQVKGLPVFDSVELRGSGIYLVASATDRYVVAMKRAEVPNVEGFYALLPVSEIRHLLATFKTTRSNGPAAVTLAVHDGQMRVAGTGGMFAGCYELAVTYRLIDGTFPDLHTFFTNWVAGEKATPVAYSAALLAKFQAALERNAYMHLLPGGPGKPTLVIAGDLFGAIMPIRDHAEAAPDPAAWLHAVQPVKAVTK